MKSDLQLRRDVLDELEWEPNIDAAQIAVTATAAGVVTLSGAVTREADRVQAERLAKTVGDVLAVANDIEVRLPGIGERNDSDIAAASLKALQWYTSIPLGKVTLTVRRGWVTLEGLVDWPSQRDAAYDAVRFLSGVKGVANQIEVKTGPQPQDIQDDIEAAFKRTTERDAFRVQVNANGGEVVLEGKVSSWTELSEAERVAWSAPGVTAVNNRLTVGG
jgi:osmotically-inducible protein OsmY